jgi:hypothetical protein
MVATCRNINSLSWLRAPTGRRVREELIKLGKRNNGGVFGGYG